MTQGGGTISKNMFELVKTHVSKLLPSARYNHILFRFHKTRAKDLKYGIVNECRVDMGGGQDSNAIFLHHK